MSLTHFLSKSSLMRSHPVFGNSGIPTFLGRPLGEGMGTRGEEGICAGWEAATSAAWTLGRRKQKKEGLALRRRPCSRPVLGVPWGAESARRLCRAELVLCCSGCITLQLALGCSREAETHGHGMRCCTHCIDSKQIAWRQIKSRQGCTGCLTAAVKRCNSMKTHSTYNQTFRERKYIFILFT